MGRMASGQSPPHPPLFFFHTHTRTVRFSDTGVQCTNYENVPDKYFRPADPDTFIDNHDPVE